MKSYEDNGWTDRLSEEAKKKFEMQYDDFLFEIGGVQNIEGVAEMHEEKFAFSIVGKGVNPDADECYEFNKYELLGWSHDASLILLAAEEFGEAMTVIANQIARAFAPTMDFVCELWDDLNDNDFYNSKKHFDGVYYKPKMFEYYKTRPNAVNLNHKIRKVRNSLWRTKREIM